MNKYGTHKKCGGEITYYEPDPYALVMSMPTWKCDKCSFVWYSELDVRSKLEVTPVLVWKRDEFSGYQYTALVDPDEAHKYARVVMQ
jgi:hypothetical protein